MHCRSCGADPSPDTRFCSRCGTRVELGSILGVGTDLPPELPARAEHPEQVRLQPGQARFDPEEAGLEPEHSRHETRGGFSAGRAVVMLATFVVLTVLGTLALIQLFGSGGPEPTDLAGSPAVQESRAPFTDAPSGPATSPSSTGTSTPSSTLPASARRCSRSGDDAVASAWSGNRDTSCAFTNAVRKAYREAGAPTEPTPFRVYSTVTKRWYDVTCEGSPIRRCADGAAVVHLGP